MSTLSALSTLYTILRKWQDVLHLYHAWQHIITQRPADEFGDRCRVLRRKHVKR